MASENNYGDFNSGARNNQLPADPGRTRSPGTTNFAEANSDFDRTPNGPPLACVDVRSVYDVRPINAFDFNIFTSTTPSASVADLNFVVPEGFVCVLRNFDLWLNPNNALEKIDSVWTLTLQNTAFPYNQGIPFGGVINRETVFLVADEFNNVGVRLTGAAITSLVTAYARFYGNFLPKTGLQTAMEIGNRNQNCIPASAGDNVRHVPTATPSAGLPSAGPVKPFPVELLSPAAGPIDPRRQLTPPTPPKSYGAARSARLRR